MECTTTVPTGSVVVLCLILGERERERGGYRHDTRNRIFILSDDDAHDDGSGGRGALTGNRLAYYHCDSHKQQPPPQR